MKSDARHPTGDKTISMTNNRIKRFVTFLSFAVLTIINTNTLHAQQESGMLEEVIVTAEKRTANVQETAISLSVFSEQALAKHGVETSMDLQGMDPSVVIGGMAGLGMPYIRGIGNEHLSIAADGSSSIYVDGVYYARTGSAISEIFDLERVEILKGPQGTLYGRNSVGGSINFITNNPDDTFGAHVDVIIGNNEKRKFRGSINVPLGENLFMRGSVVTGKSEGFFTNLTDPFEDVNLSLHKTDPHYGGDDIVAGRFKFLYQAADDITVTLGVDYSKDKRPYTVLLTYNPAFPSPGVDFDRDIPNVGLPGPLDDGATPGRSHPDPYKNYLNVTPEEVQKQEGVNLTVEWDYDFATLKSISSYREYFNDSIFDLDGTDYPDGFQGMFTDSETFTQEFQLTSPAENGSLQWVGGLFYLDDEGLQNVPVSLANGQQLIDFRATLDVWAWAAYGQLSYFFSDNLRLTAGARYSKEKKEVAYDHLITVFPGSLDIMIPIVVSGEQEWDSFDPKIGIDYFVNDDVMLYASASKAFKSGGFNTLSLDFSTQEFDPEEILAYEVGVKSELLDRRVRVNLAAFYYDYTDLQQNQYSEAAVIVVNADSATVKGIDVDVTALVADGLELRAAVSYLDAKFDEFLTVDPLHPELGVQDLGELGYRLPRAPEWAYNVAATYTHQLGAHGSLTWLGEYVWKDEVFHSPFNLDGVSQDSFGLLNARVTWRTPAENWSVSLWGKNLTDETWYQNSVVNLAFVGGVRQPADPRTYGITVTADW